MPTTVANVIAKSVAGTVGQPDTHRDQSEQHGLLPTNVGDAERLLSLIGGGALIAYGLSCRGLTGILLPVAGGLLAARGVTGSCAMYRALGVNTADSETKPGVEAGAGYKVDQVVTIDKPARELYAFWRHFDNLPRVMSHLKEVRVLDEKRSHWVAKAPLGLSVGWDAEIITDRPNELIGWQSLPGSDVNTAGSVHFTQAPGNRGTEVRVELKYDPPAGKLGAWFATLFGKAPGQEVRDDLFRFKSLMETGEVVTTKGQSHGRR